MITDPKQFFDTIIYSINTADLLKQNYLTPLRYQSRDFFNLNYKVSSDSKLVSQMTFKFGTAIPNIFQIPELIKKSTRTLVFVPNIVQARFLEEQYPDLIRSIDGSMKNKKRSELLKQFKNGDIKALANCEVLTTGYDEPLVDQIILLRPTKSHSLLLQMLGRGMRLSPGKKFCNVFDAVGATKYLGFPEDWSVEKDPFEWNVFASLASKKTYLNNKMVSYFEKDL